MKANHLTRFVQKVNDSFLPVSSSLPGIDQKIIPEGTIELIKTYERCARKHTKMETTTLVILLVLEVLKRTKDVELQLQPSIEDHQTLTDFVFVVKRDSTPLLIIEVKNAATDCLLKPSEDATAQVLREAHILLTQDSSHQKINFVLTNSMSWGFGEAVKVSGNMIRVTSIAHHLLPVPINFENEAVYNLLNYLEKLLTSC